jgi:malate dehydrogenase (oxaloacetate-decarboxylating)(NADP+)
VTKAAPVPHVVLDAYKVSSLSFGPEYIIPKPMDPRVLVEESLAVAKAAVDSGVATRPISDWDGYRKSLEDLSLRIQRARAVT